MSKPNQPRSEKDQYQNDPGKFGRYFHEAVNVSLDGFALVQKLQIVQANPALTEMLGIPAYQVPGLQLKEILDASLFSQIEQHDFEQQSQLTSLAGTLRRKDDKLLRITVKIVALNDEENLTIAQFTEASQKLETMQTQSLTETNELDQLRQSLHAIAVVQGFPPKLILANKAMEKLLGFNKKDLLKMSASLLFSILSIKDAKKSIEDLYKQWFDGDQIPTRRLALAKTKDGPTKTLEILTSRITVGGQTALQLVCADITNKIKLTDELDTLQSQLFNAQKLESLGELAAGIAHSFNNLLLGILGNTDLALMDIPSSSPAMGYLLDIRTTAERAADLSNQMLAYSGKGELSFDDLNLNEIVKDMGPLVDISTRSKVDVKYELSPHVPIIEADPPSIRQVLLNLVGNASDAVCDRDGRITISTGVRRCTKQYLATTFIDDSLEDGMYVHLDVTDNGTGIDKQALERVFDPFFTTKTDGRGLGLAAILGIVRCHKGAVKVESSQDSGTSFRLLFPAKNQPPSEGKSTTLKTPIPQGTGTVLVVDDDNIVRTTVRNMLTRLGFGVVTAYDGEEAVKIFRKRSNEIRLVLLDITMKHMDGIEAFKRIREIDSDANIIMMSGYSRSEIPQNIDINGTVAFLQKPFVTKDIMAILKTLVDA